jgi:hypothetical protein
LKLFLNPERRLRKTRIALAIAAAVLIVGLGAVTEFRDRAEPQAMNAPPTAPSVLGAYSDPPASRAGKEATLETTPSKAAPPAVAKPSPRLYPRDEEYRALMASADPNANAKVYALAWSCANEAENLRMNERVPGAAPTAPNCGLAPGSWQDAELRKKGVVAAAKLGLPNGWAHLYLEEGPGGRLSAFSEAERAEWQQLAVETYTIALNAKDSAALGHEAVVQEAAGNYARAAELYVASAAALARRTNQPYQSPDESLAQIRAKLAPADFNSAVISGRKMAETVKAGELL